MGVIIRHLERNTMVLLLEDVDDGKMVPVDINLQQSAHTNAGSYYAMAKKAGGKLKRTEVQAASACSVVCIAGLAACPYRTRPTVR